MNIEDFSIKVKDLIGKGKFKMAIKLMRELLQESPHLNEVLAQSGRYQELERQERLGIVNYEKATIEKNKIRLALLGLVEEIRGNIETDVTIKQEFENINPQNVYSVLKGTKYFKWFYLIALSIILSGVVFMGRDAYQSFYPKSDEPIDDNRCWVKTKAAFASLMHEPSFIPKDIITDLPGNKKYHVLEIATLVSGEKSYKIEDKKLKVTGWVNGRSLSEKNIVCFQK